MNRTLALLLAVVLCCGTLVACGQTGADDTSGQTTAGTTTIGDVDSLTTTTTLSGTAQVTTSSSQHNQITSTTRQTTTQFQPTVTTLTRPKNTSSKKSTTATKKATTTKPAVVKPLVAIDPADYYGRSLLSGDLRQAYDRIVAAVEDLDSSVSFSGLSVSKNDLLRVLQYYCDDYPHHFYLDDDELLISYSGNKANSLSLKYTMSKSQIATAKSKLESAVTAMLSGIHGGMTAYERERLIYNRIIHHVVYTKSSDASIYTIYGALVNKKAVCDGYAHALQYLLYRAGIPCIRVTGSSKSESHVWNMVQLSGKWYHVDVTWDDPVISGVSDFAGYSYLNVTESQIKKDHTISPIVSGGITLSYDLPDATATTYYYFNQTGPTLSSFQYSTVLAHCRSVAAEGGTWAGFKVTGSANTFISKFTENYFNLQDDMSGYFQLNAIQYMEPVDGIIYIYIK